MQTKTILALVLAVGLAIAGWICFTQSSPPETVRMGAAPEQPSNPTPPTVTPAPTHDPSTVEQAGNISEGAPPQTAKTETPQKAAPKSTPTKKPKEPLRDPLAREAMALVGVDPEAEAYWLEAIYDSSLPDNEREDLIEDLNEEGLSDHKRPGPEDFPLIMNRIAIIEEIVPHADDFMLPHLREAYKDLLNLAEISQGGGRPVR